MWLQCWQVSHTCRIYALPVSVAGLACHIPRNIQRSCTDERPRAEDDWELYEEAALQRVVESDHEEEDSKKSSSLDSLPTY